jgi:hypothetical protein
LLPADFPAERDLISNDTGKTLVVTVFKNVEDLKQRKSTYHEPRMIYGYCLFDYTVLSKNLFFLFTRGRRFNGHLPAGYSKSAHSKNKKN